MNSGQEPPPKKRKLNTRHVMCNANANHNRNTTHNSANTATVDELMQLIENEPNETIERNVLQQMIVLLKSKIVTDKSNHSLHLKLSWAYLRSGQYDEGISYFDDVLPQRDHDKYYDLDDDEDSDLEITETSIPLQYEISIRVNVALMLCRICDFEEALRHTLIMRDLYNTDTYDPYIDFIQMKVTYHQKLWNQSILCGEQILSQQKKKKGCKLDNHSLFELHCVLGDCYSCVGKLDAAGRIFADIVLPHIQLDLSLEFHWIYEIYLRHLYHKKEWERGYVLCMKLFAHHIAYRYNSNMMRLCELFNVKYHCKGDEVHHFVIDAEYFGNQCRFVNHSEDCNCVFVVRHTFGNTMYPSAMEVWLKSTKKIEKKQELLVNYGENYWKNVKNAPRLKKRSKWDEGFVFTHLMLDEMAAVSWVEMKQLIERHHAQNQSLFDKTYPSCIQVQEDKHGGYGCYATRTIKRNTFIMRYAGIRKLSTDLDQSTSRYSIEVRDYDDTD
eukprot:1036586_1